MNSTYAAEIWLNRVDFLSGMLFAVFLLDQGLTNSAKSDGAPLTFQKMCKTFSSWPMKKMQTCLSELLVF